MSTIVPSIASSFPLKGDEWREAGLSFADAPAKTA